MLHSEVEHILKERLQHRTISPSDRDVTQQGQQCLVSIPITSLLNQPNKEVELSVIQIRNKKAQSGD
ncbi:hypothetical protein WICPIJ_002142 [Wickerhamomyces pijperi]|uniref:Uncharacterized protein n=1 Tax=Wickerhamomyces pijperi TaxID=599730 RepID=A0A9P8QA88_WICPI|nr:hypothetical protein WICPIJ_002142 [Wickerhamomyces pijperi]